MTFSVESEPKHVSWALQPGGLWSLWEMLEIHAREFIALGEEMNELETHLHMDEVSGEASNNAWMLQHLKRMRALAERMKVGKLVDLIDARLRDPPQTQREYAQLKEAVIREFKDERYFHIPSPRSVSYERWPFEADVRKAFPNAAQELRLAGNCYAVELPVASVVHSARAMEIGLRALALGLACKFEPHEKPLEETQLEVIIDKCAARLTEIKKSKQYEGKSADVVFYSDALLRAATFKDAARVQAAHVRAQFTSQQALSYYTDARKFFVDVAKRLSETGRPGRQPGENARHVSAARFFFFCRFRCLA